MGIDVHGDTRIRVTHEILQAFDVHSCVRHVGAEGVAEHMRRNVRQRLIRIQGSIPNSV